jgi:hypothetical protein
MQGAIALLSRKRQEPIMKISGIPKPLVRGVIRFFAALAAGVCMGMMVLAATAVVREVQAFAFRSESTPPRAAGLSQAVGAQQKQVSQVAHGQIEGSAANMSQIVSVEK